MILRDPALRRALAAALAAASLGGAARARASTPLRPAPADPAPLTGSLYVSPDGRWACTVCTGSECSPCHPAAAEPEP